MMHPKSEKVQFLMHFVVQIFTKYSNFFSKYVAFSNAQFLDGVHFLMHPKSGGVQFMMHPKSERVQFMMHPKSEEVQFLMHFVVQPGSGCIKNCSIVKQ